MFSLSESSQKSGSHLGGAGVNVGNGVGVAAGIGVAVGNGVGAGVAVGVSVGVAVDNGVGVALGVAVSVGADVGNGIGAGVAVGATVGVLAGFAVGVGCDVKVGAGVSNLVVGGWSPMTGDSEVGRVENIPGGVGDAGTSAGASQAVITGRMTKRVDPTVSRLMKLFGNQLEKSAGNGGLLKRIYPTSVRHG